MLEPIVFIRYKYFKLDVYKETENLSGHQLNNVKTNLKILLPNKVLIKVLEMLI